MNEPHPNILLCLYASHLSILFGNIAHYTLTPLVTVRYETYIWGYILTLNTGHEKQTLQTDRLGTHWVGAPPIALAGRWKASITRAWWIPDSLVCYRLVLIKLFTRYTSRQSLATHFRCYFYFSLMSKTFHKTSCVYNLKFTWLLCCHCPNRLLFIGFQMFINMESNLFHKYIGTHDPFHDLQILLNQSFYKLFLRIL